MSDAQIETGATSLAVAALTEDPAERAAIREAFAAVGRWDVHLLELEGMAQLLSAEARGQVDLAVLYDRGPQGDGDSPLRRLRAAGFAGAVLVLVDETSDPRSFVRAGADATLDRSNLDPIFLESMVAVALTLPHRGR